MWLEKLSLYDVNDTNGKEVENISYTRVLTVSGGTIDTTSAESLVIIICVVITKIFVTWCPPLCPVPIADISENNLIKNADAENKVIEICSEFANNWKLFIKSCAGFIEAAQDLMNKKSRKIYY